MKLDKDIELRKVFIDEIGKAITNYADQPNYYYYSEGNQFIIGVELPGEGASIKTKLQRSEDFYVFDFKGKRPGSKNENNKNSKINKNLRDEINFNFIIRIPLKDIDILPNKIGNLNYNDKLENQNGVTIFKYNLNDGNNDNDYE